MITSKQNYVAPDLRFISMRMELFFCNKSNGERFSDSVEYDDGTGWN